jgi:hypothetical protein
MDPMDDLTEPTEPEPLALAGWAIRWPSAV